jgi:hypothetical protein
MDLKNSRYVLFLYTILGSPQIRKIIIMKNYLKPILFLTFFAGTEHVCAASGANMPLDPPLVAEGVISARDYLEFYERVGGA